MGPLEVSALQQAGRRGLLARHSALLKLQGDERLIALVRDGNAGAFEVIIDRYQSRLLSFCRQLLHSTEDAEDVLQEVFINAHRAMLADARNINLRPWLYRISRNLCLNHLRDLTADPKESMDEVPVVEAASTAELVHNREEFRQLLGDVQKLPETQRTVLLLREINAMPYDDIAQAMNTTVPSVKSLLVRARMSLTEASKARLLTCGEVRLELAQAAAGLGKASGEVRRHVRDCPGCEDYRRQLRSDGKVLAALSPIGPLIALKTFIGSKLGLGGGAGASSGAAGAGGGAATGAAGAGAAGAGAISSGGTGGLSVIGGAVGAKAAAGVVSAAVLTVGALDDTRSVIADPNPSPTIARVLPESPKPSIAIPLRRAPLEATPIAAGAPSSPAVDPAPVVVLSPVPVGQPVAHVPATEANPGANVDPSSVEISAGAVVSVTADPHPSVDTGTASVGSGSTPADQHYLPPKNLAPPGAPASGSTPTDQHYLPPKNPAPPGAGPSGADPPTSSGSASGGTPAAP